MLRTYRGMRAIDLVRLFTSGSLGISLFLPLFDIRTNRILLLRWSPYWVPVTGSLLIALNADRRVGSLFPVLIPAGLNGIRVLADRLEASAKDFQVIFLIQFALLLLNKDFHVIPFDLVAAVFLASLCWLVARAQFRRTAPALQKA